MYRKLSSSWMKRWDFALIDMVCMELSFFFACFIRHGEEMRVLSSTYMKFGLNLLIINLAVMLFVQSYREVIKRGYGIEVIETIKHVVVVQIVFLLYQYLIKEAESLSRIIYVLTWIFSCMSCYLGRIVLKSYLRKKIITSRPSKRILVMSSEEKVRRCIERLLKDEYHEFLIEGIGILDIEQPVNLEQNVSNESTVEEIPRFYGKNEIIEYIRRGVVDEVVIDSYQNREELNEWVELFLTMGITVHMNLGYLPENLPNRDIEKLGDVYVVTTSIKTANTWELFCKRLLDIIGAIIGLILTGIAFLFVAPAIQKVSPGPVFFKQERVGKNGRIFHIYKFRSMYMDAEARKAELMKYNEMQGLMFKMENDPRIIGSEKGPGKGLGNFLRKSSIDELPQFWNVLKGDMSLVGTRPPTVKEYEQYELRHRVRLSIKPGLTGLWQTSGRSTITDFEEVVRLDSEYIKNWSLALDIKLIFKTIKVVIMRTGSK